MVKGPWTRYEFGWCVYDWAKSAFETVMLTAVLPPYFLEVAPNHLHGLGLNWPAASIWSYSLGISALVLTVLMPAWGAAADSAGTRYRSWILFTVWGCLAATTCGLLPSSAWVWILLTFLIAFFGFSGGNVFYNALLLQVTRKERYDLVSGWGYALGYVGGGLFLGIVALWLHLAPRQFGWSLTTVTRQGLAATGVWWLTFGVLSFFALKGVEPQGVAIRSMKLFEGWKKVWSTFRSIRRYRAVLSFLAAFLLYNDGVETTILMAAVYGKEVLKLNTQQLVLIILLVQFTAFPGALSWSKIALRRGTKRSILDQLIIWAILTGAAAFVGNFIQFMVLACGFALVLGGIQALSRSYFARLIPAEESAEFFGFFAVTAKFSTIFGPLWVGFARQVFGDLRYALGGLIMFYCVGYAILSHLSKTADDSS